MQQHPLFRIETFAVAFLVISILGFALDPSSFLAVTFVWAFYVLVFAILGVRRTGISGLGFPSFAYIATAMLHPPVAALALGVGMICALFCVPIAFMGRTRKQPVEPRTVRSSGSIEPVSIAVPPAPGGDLLSRLGLGSE